MRSRLFQVAALGILACAPALAAQPMPVPGGALDPAFVDADIYVGTPSRPTVPPGAACKAAANYVELIRQERYDALPALFTTDAVLYKSSQLRVHGTEEIRRFYADRIGRLKPKVVAVHYEGGRTDCLVEVAVEQIIDGKSRYRLAGMDHFTVDQSGKVFRVISFPRQSRMELKSLKSD